MNDFEKNIDLVEIVCRWRQSRISWLKWVWSVLTGIPLSILSGRDRSPVLIEWIYEVLSMIPSHAGSLQNRSLCPQPNMCSHHLLAGTSLDLRPAIVRGIGERRLHWQMWSPGWVSWRTAYVLYRTANAQLSLCPPPTPPKTKIVLKGFSTIDWSPILWIHVSDRQVVFLVQKPPPKNACVVKCSSRNRPLSTG